MANQVCHLSASHYRQFPSISFLFSPHPYFSVAVDVPLLLSFVFRDYSRGIVRDSLLPLQPGHPDAADPPVPPPPDCAVQPAALRRSALSRAATINYPLRRGFVRSPSGRQCSSSAYRNPSDQNGWATMRFYYLARFSRSAVRLRYAGNFSREMKPCLSSEFAL